MHRFPPFRKLIAVLGISSIGTVLALALRFSGDDIVPLLASVFVSAWFFGMEGGVAATVFTSVFALVIVADPDRGGWTQTAELAVLGTAMSLLMERLHYSSFRLSAMLSSIADAVIATDRSGNVQWMNEQAEALAGITLNAARRKPLHQVIRLRDQKSGQDVRFPVDAITSGEAQATAPRRLLLVRDGVESDVEETIAPLRTQKGRVAGAVLTIRDTTRRREAEDQLTRSQKMEALARLAEGVAGDFNNLLTVITGYGEMLRGEMMPADPLRRFADEIIFAADRSAAVTRQLMAFSRHQSAQTRLIDLNTSIAGMETVLTRLLGSRIDLVIVPGPGVLRVKADPGQIEQVFVNLAMNSRDAMPDGGRFILETSAVDLAPGTPGVPESLAPGPYVQLTVSDTGAGMDAATRSRLFEPFFTTKGQGKGTGLGLSIVYGIIRQAGGDIGVYSQPGGGTIFEIYIPRCREQEATFRRASRGPRGSETILVADDDDGVRKLVHAVLATSGYTVIEATDGKEALNQYLSEPDRFDMLLTDVVMPNMNGFELGNRVGELNPELKILYMSGFRDTPLAGAEPERPRLFLHKPFTPDSLLVRVREVLDQKTPQAPV